MKIYFDMDGVLVDFDSATPGGKQFNHPSESLSPELRAAKKQFWQKIEQNKNFWRDIPVIPGAKEMLNTAKKYAEIFVLSKTPGAKHFNGGDAYVDFVADEKRKWILTNLGDFFDTEHIIICKASKGDLIHPNKTDILVDDRSENIADWESHGGRGILFQNADNAIKQIKI